MSPNPKPKTVLIAGCGPHGIGSALAREFQRKGHTVFATGRTTSPQDLDPLLAQEQFLQNGAGGVIHTLALDVTLPESISAAKKSIISILENDPSSQRGGGECVHLDILINNAGLLSSLPFSDTPVTEARRIFEVNLLGAWAVTHEFLPLLLPTTGTTTSTASESEGGIIASLCSINSTFNPPFLAAYNASKAALESWSRSIRRELAPLGVKVVILKTGSVRTDLFENNPAGNLPEGSLYSGVGNESVKAYIEERPWINDKRAGFISVEKFAREVVEELTREKRNVKSVIWKGGMIWLAWLVGWFAWWETMLDSALMKAAGLDKLTRPQPKVE